MSSIKEGIICEYIWITGTNLNNNLPWTIRSKSRRFFDTSKLDMNDVTTIPEWNYDGSSTNQATTSSSEIILKPQAIFTDPFYQDEVTKEYTRYLILCDTYTYDAETDKYVPHADNYRYQAAKLFTEKNNKEYDPWFGIEQEFFLMNKKTRKPLGYINDEVTEKQGLYYCSVGGQYSAGGRSIVNTMYNKAIIAGINVTGLNAEVAPGQFEIQVMEKNINVSDQLWILRYIITYTALLYYPDIYISFHTKPLTEGEWNGSGCHMNYSTEQMRRPAGLNEINRVIDNLSTDKNHRDCLAAYGEFNQLRLTGKFETSTIDKFSYGVANRGASVRIPTMTVKNRRGYFEDRRPSSLVDPYKATAKIFELTIN